MTTDAPSPPDLSLVSHMDALPAGTRLGEFELTGLLGVGGFGMVYAAWDHSLERRVAIKEYMPAALAGRSKGAAVSMRSATDEQTFLAGLKSFVGEAKLLARFDHPSLVKVYRFWEQNNTAYMAMPLYQGITLKQARQQMRCPPPEAWLRKVMWSVLEALRVLHDAGTMHRDVSPDNIFLQDVGPPVLLDLGAARRAIHDRSHKHTAILKVNYAPIEQYADTPDLRQGAWTDLYALGAVIHGCLCNEPPLPSTFRVIRDRLNPMADVARAVEDHFGQAYSDAFVHGVQHALAVQPDDRPQTVAQMQAELQLDAVAGIAQFDWRGELGDIWAPDKQRHASASGVLTDIQVSSDDGATHVLSATVPGDMAARITRRDPALPDLDLDAGHMTAPMPERTVPLSAAMGVDARAAATAASDAGASAGVAVSSAVHVAAPSSPQKDVSRPALRPLFPDPTSGKPASTGGTAGQTVSNPSHRTGRGLMLAVVTLVVVSALGGLWALRSQFARPGASGGEATSAAPLGAPNNSPPGTSAAKPGAGTSPVTGDPSPGGQMPPGVTAVAAAKGSAPTAGRPASAASTAAAAPTRPKASAAPAAGPTGGPGAAAAVSAASSTAADERRPGPPPATPQRPTSATEPLRAASSAGGTRVAPTPAPSIELCADAGLFTKPMCIHRECAKPEFLGHPTCIEQRRRDRENAERMNSR